jgi:3-phosphoshikimate 1-carboxyvinyltransferase
MHLTVHPSRLGGSVPVPGSKSHTMRAVAIGSLADGRSIVRSPLLSADARAVVRAYQLLGATIDTSRDDVWTIDGVAGRPVGPGPDRVIDVLNSGTTVNFAMATAALIESGQAHLTGDAQIQRRPAGPLIAALNDLGARVVSDRDNGCPPLTVHGTLAGGSTTLEARNSQFLSALLINCPLAARDTHISISLLFERPYVQITLDWLARCGVTVQYDSFDRFHIPGRQAYRPFDIRVPADFSSATFFLGAGALGDNDITSAGLDMNDPQGDKQVVDYLRKLGADVAVTDAGIRVRSPGTPLRGCELDLNATPDALPMMAVLGCFAQGETRLVNVPQARIKETDRIAVMAEELQKMGADIEQLPDGLVVRQSDLHGASVDGHDDHRVVMALAVAATAATRDATTIGAAHAIHVTFPTFIDRMRDLGAAMHTTA